MGLGPSGVQQHDDNDGEYSVTLRGVMAMTVVTPSHSTV